MATADPTATPMARALAASHRATQRLAGVTVTVRRGDAACVVTAVLGETQWERESVEGIVDNLLTTRDFLIAAADYDFGDGPVEPSDADKIELLGPAGVETYRLDAPQPQQSWRYTDRYRQTLRIHTTLESARKT